MIRSYDNESEGGGFVSRLKQQLPSGRKLTYSLVAFFVIAFGLLSGNLIENLDASHVMVIQKVDGTLDCYTEPGPYWQGFGAVTTYPRRGTYKFDAVGDGKTKIDEGKGLQFNDGGTGKLYGQINWQMPIDCKSIVAIHKDFGSAPGIEERGVQQMVKTAFTLSGMTMTSMESFAERKAELFEFINDQAQNGSYQMRTRSVERMNPITGKAETASVAEVVRDNAGKPMRQHGSILEQYGITLQPLAIDHLEYSDVVKAQITARQDALTQVTVSQAKAAKSIQDAITFEKDGQAAAAKTKWAQEALKATAVTLAEQEKAVAILAAERERDTARLGREAAEFYKQQQILKGEGDAAYRQKVMMADGALGQKLEAWKFAMGKFAEEFGKQKWVPEVQMGGAGATGANAAQAMMETLQVQAARQLALDMGMARRTGEAAHAADSAPAPAAKPAKK